VGRHSTPRRHSPPPAVQVEAPRSEKSTAEPVAVDLDREAGLLPSAQNKPNRKPLRWRIHGTSFIVGSDGILRRGPHRLVDPQRLANHQRPGEPLDHGMGGPPRRGGPPGRGRAAAGATPDEPRMVLCRRHRPSLLGEDLLKTHTSQANGSAPAHSLLIAARPGHNIERVRDGRPRKQ